ncbi:hypothetical protein E4T52_06388 [Aureobasidium sp. EXF-3400]|nr:hypothetical protein E4T51_05538 [Aureobasidium sp. EXF-12344]KAI4778687.1 hypothetical protein E4T52_06388 [Aureobasidium sp. EXF-3400]
MDEDNFFNGFSEEVFLGGNDNWFEQFTCDSPSTDLHTEDKFSPVRSCDRVTSNTSPAAEKIGNVPEIWMNILAQADQVTLQSAIRVNKAWYTEGLPFLWHSPTEAGLRFDGISRRQPESITLRAGLVRHIQYSVWTDRGYQGRTYNKSRKKQAMPELPNLTSLECLTSSLSERTAAQLRSIFVRSLKQVVIEDCVAYNRYTGRLEELGGVSWFDIMCIECPDLETLSLGEGNMISREDFHHFMCRAIHLRTIKLDRGNEHLLIDLVRPLLKSLKVSPGWMMRHDSYDILSQLNVLEYLDIAVGDATITNEKLLSLQHLKHLVHLHIWPSDNIGTTRCTVTAAELVSFIEALPELIDFRIWLEFDFFCFEEAIEAAYDLPGRYPQFDNLDNRRSYLNYLREMAEVEYEAASEKLEQH